MSSTSQGWCHSLLKSVPSCGGWGRLVRNQVQDWGAGRGYEAEGEQSRQALAPGGDGEDAVRSESREGGRPGRELPGVGWAGALWSRTKNVPFSPSIQKRCFVCFHRHLSPGCREQSVRGVQSFREGRPGAGGRRGQMLWTPRSGGRGAILKGMGRCKLGGRGEYFNSRWTCPCQIFFSFFLSFWLIFTRGSSSAGF